MGKITIARIRGTIRKSKLTKVGKNLYHCPTCGAFKKVGNAKKKKK